MLKTECDRSCSFDEFSSSDKSFLLLWLQTKLSEGKIKNYPQVESGVRNGIILNELINVITGR
jgi:hypothetical protein